MVSIPLEWTLSIKGGSQVKSTMDDLDSAFKRGQISQDDYNSSLSQLNKTSLRGINVNRYRNNILLAEHPNLLRVSRAMSTVTSITRTLLTISNALNISKMNGSLQDANTIAITNERNKLQRELNELEKQGLGNSERAIQLREDLSVANAQLQESNQALIDQKWEGLATGVSSALLTVTSVFNLLIKNGTILKALTSAGSYFGGVFSGMFTLAASAINKITTWLFPPTVVSKAAVTSAVAGTTTGAAFGAAFQIAAIAGLVIAIAAMFDFLIEQITGWSFVKEIQKAFGIKDAKSVGGMVGYQSPAAVPLTGINDYDDYIKNSGFAGSKNKGIMPSSSSTLNDSVAKSLKESFTPLVTSVNNTDINFKNLNSGLITNSTNTLEANKILADYSNYQKEFNPADKTAREDMKNKTVDLKNMLSNNATNTGLNVLITDKLITSNTALTNATNSLASSFKSGGSSSGGGTISSSNVYTSPYGNPTGAFAQPSKRATGFEGMVNTPQLMMVGDAGPEYVSVTPHGGTRSGGGTTIIVNVAGSIWNERQLFSRLDDIQKNNLKRRGFTGT